MAGGGPQTTQSSTTQQSGVPKWAQGPFRGSVADWLNAQGALPNISSLYGNMPELNVPNLTPDQLKGIGAFENQPMGPNSQQQSALSSLAQFTPGANGISPLTAATEKQFNTATLPTIQNAAANMGQGNSGAMLEAIQNGQVNALVPELTAQNQQQLQAATATGQIGGQINAQDVTTLTNSLQAAGLPYQVAQAQAQAYFNQQQSKSQLAQEIQMGPFSQLGSIFGKGNSTTIGTSPGTSKF